LFDDAEEGEVADCFDEDEDSDTSDEEPDDNELMLIVSLFLRLP